jgi:peroxiredoxin
VEELPLLNAFYQEHRSRGWQVLGLAVDQPGAVRTFLQRLPLQFPVAMAGLGGTDLAKSLGNATGGLPFTVVVDAKGAIAHRKLGKVSPDDLKQWVQVV